MSIIDICINYFKTQSSKLMGNWQVMDSTNYYNNSKLYFILNKKSNVILVVFGADNRQRELVMNFLWRTVDFSL